MVWFKFNVVLLPQRPPGLWRTGSPGRPPRLSHSFWALRYYSSSSVLLYIHRDHKDYEGRGAQDVHLDFHTAPELWVVWLGIFNVRGDVDACDWRRGLHGHRKRVSTESWLWEKNRGLWGFEPASWLLGPTLYRLSYPASRRCWGSVCCCCSCCCL